jgi:hypothetical protein
MGFLDRLRALLSGPPHIDDPSGDEPGAVAADMHEEYGAPDEGAADLKRMESTLGGAVMPGVAGAAAAETAESDLESEEAPPDPHP